MSVVRTFESREGASARAAPRTGIGPRPRSLFSLIHREAQSPEPGRRRQIRNQSEVLVAVGSPAGFREPCRVGAREANATFTGTP